jgi:hypothetical protein
MKYLAIVMLLTSSLAAQETSKHKFMDKQNIALFSADALVRTLDWQSTTKFMHDPCHCYVEDYLPNSIAGNSPVMLVYSLGVSTSIMGLSYLAHRTGHHKIERLIPVGDVVYDGRLVVGNYRLHPLHR